MIVETKCDLLKGIRPWSVILHQTNCLGIAGAGVARQIRDAFPGWYQEYKSWCDREEQKDSLLGTVHSYFVRPDLAICSAFAQLGISKAEPVTDYTAWDAIMRRIERETAAKNAKDSMNWEIRIPHGIGCGLGGGDWKTMRDMFEFYFGKSPVRLVICRL